MAPPPGKLEFNEITLIYRNESKGGEPTEVTGRDFYPAFREYLKRLKSDSEDEVRKDPTFMKASSMMSEIKKVMQKGSSIFQYRMSKIMSMALRAGMGSKVDTTRLTPEEKDFFDAVVEEVVACRSLSLDGEKVATRRSVPTSPCSVPVRKRWRAALLCSPIPAVARTIQGRHWCSSECLRTSPPSPAGSVNTAS